ncbi:hypothetical protein OJ996_19445 [Luteolibacter sp. GHJ8]|jgi:hypothetical protein|uniref:UbiA prenyltransferase family protein n=1 Tax=Luteolibacter rhizosphaerae TaxID=2989719 RepID=A0ABT3G994_9BACT|nr:hypothetical protein [Luteolibacter rhizosphaerae]MCW1915770.1 hypothetical protein [Luteolibacter rhizosphaerae]
MPDRRTPLWLWPNLLSLDAPAVAMAWLFMFQKIWLQVLPWGYYAALGLAVWGIYILDRIIDVKMLSPGDHRLGERHEFHQRHMKFMSILAVVTLLGSAFVAGGHISFGPLVDYGKPVIFLVVVFFSLTIFSKQDREIPHLRNLFAGLAFSYGTAMGAHMWSWKPGIFDAIHPPFNLALSPEMLAFAVLCTLNISAIHFWEQSAFTRDRERGAANDLSLTIPLTGLAAAAIGLAVLDEESRSRPFYYAVLISSALIYVLNRVRSKYSVDALRVMADAAMIAPLPVFIALSANL